MSNITLKPITGQQYKVHAEHSHPKLSLRRVVWVKILRWLDKATLRDLTKAGCKLSYTALLLIAVASPTYAAGVIVQAMQWNQYRIPLGIFIFFFVWYFPTLLRFCRKKKRSTANQHTYEGIAIDELVTFLVERNGFPFKDATKDLGLTQPRWRKIAKALESAQILLRGDNNALVLNTITREELVRQLRDSFPLVYSEHDKAWTERRSGFDSWLLQKERKEAKERNHEEKRKKKLKRLNKKIEEANQVVFTQSKVSDYGESLAPLFAHNA